MKPIQQHKDPRITNISFDNFTGSISIITSIPNEEEEEESKDLMLSSPHTNGGVDIFKPNHHLPLITQPILGARSRKKDKTDSITNSRRSSYNDSPSLIFPINRTEKFQYEKKSNHHESSDSGLDFSLSTNSSVQYPQQYTTTHRPLSALNEDLNTDDGFDEQPIQQYRSLNDLPKKSLRKETKLNIIIEPSRLNIHDEQIHSITRTTSSSSNQQIKPKAITPLGHYPNQEQIRAHINRSVIERQHPSYLSIPKRKSIIPIDTSSLKVNNILSQQQKQSTKNPNNQGGGSIIPSRQTKQTLPGLYNEQIIDDHRKEKRRLNNINKWEEHSQKDIQEPLKTNQRRASQQDRIDNFLTSTPRRPNEHYRILKRQKPINQTYRSKPTGVVNQNKNRLVNPNSEFESEYSLQNPVPPFQSRPRKLVRIPNIQFHPREKSPTESINNLLKTTRIQPMNSNNFRQENELNRLSQKNSNRFFQTRSPTSWSIISDQQINHYESSPSSSPLHNELINDKSTRTYRLIVINEQQSRDGRSVIPNDHSQLPSYIDSSSQTSSRHTYPFTTDSNNINDITRDNSSHELTENLVDHRNCSSSSLEHFSPNDRFPLPLGKVTIAMEEDDISTNYDSDDGWSDDSAELIYVDERYKTQKKKIIPPSSSSHLVSQQQ